MTRLRLSPVRHDVQRSLGCFPGAVPHTIPWLVVVHARCFAGLSELAWAVRRIQMLDNVRYLICWLPIILTALHFALDWAGLSHHYTGRPKGHFETFRDGTLHWCACCAELKAPLQAVDLCALAAMEPMLQACCTMVHSCCFAHRACKPRLLCRINDTTAGNDTLGLGNDTTAALLGLSAR